MTVTTGFTSAAAIAVIANSVFLFRSLQRAQALTELKQNGRLRQVANAFIQVWVSILVADLFMFGAGAGILSGHRLLGYLLVGMPLVSVAVGIFALRGFE